MARHGQMVVCICPVKYTLHIPPCTSRDIFPVALPLVYPLSLAWSSAQTASVFYLSVSCTPLAGSVSRGRFRTCDGTWRPLWGRVAAESCHGNPRLSSIPRGKGSLLTCRLHTASSDCKCKGSMVRRFGKSARKEAEHLFIVEAFTQQ